MVLFTFPPMRTSIIYIYIYISITLTQLCFTSFPYLPTIMYIYPQGYLSFVVSHHPISFVLGLIHYVMPATTFMMMMMMMMMLL